MSEENKMPQENLPAFVKAAPELLPVWDWWVKEGKSTLLMLVLVGIGVAGFYGVRNWLTARNAAANQALVNAYNVEELETAVRDYGSTKAGSALRLRLAKAYYDAARYEESLKVYDALVAKSAKNAAFADVAVLGRGHALEGLTKYADAEKVFADYAKANTNSYLVLDAQMSAARCKALQGNKDAAVKELDALKAATKDEIAKNRIERMTDAIKRYDPKRQARSLLDAANEAAKSLEAAKKPATPAPAAKPATPAPAPAAKPATPAPAPAAKPATPAPAPAAKPATPAPAPAAKPATSAPAPAAKPATPAPAPAPAAKPAEAKK